MSSIKIWVKPKEVRKKTMLIPPNHLWNSWRTLFSQGYFSNFTRCSLQLIKPMINKLKAASGLGGSELPQKLATPFLNSEQSKTTTGNWKIKRKLLHETGRATTHLGISQLSNLAPHALLKLWKHMSWPAGCAFLRTKATTTKVWLGEHGRISKIL